MRINSFFISAVVLMKLPVFILTQKVQTCRELVREGGSGSNTWSYGSPVSTANSTQLRGEGRVGAGGGGVGGTGSNTWDYGSSVSTANSTQLRGKGTVVG